MSSRDPYSAFRFLVEVDSAVVGGFMECSGLTAETEVEEIQEGGENRFRHKLLKGTKYGNLTLKRGLTDSTVLWDWFRARSEDEAFDKGKRKSLAVILWNESTKDQVWRWDFRDAFPLKWVGPDLKAETGAISIETVEFGHSGISSGGPV